MSELEDYKRIQDTYRDAISSLHKSIQEAEEQINGLIAHAVADLDRIEGDMLAQVSILHGRIAEMRSVILSRGDTHGLPTSDDRPTPRTITEKVLFCLNDFPIGQEISYQNLVTKILATFPEINQLSLPNPIRMLVLEGRLIKPRRSTYIIPSRS